MEKVLKELCTRLKEINSTLTKIERQMKQINISTGQVPNSKEDGLDA